MVFRRHKKKTIFTIVLIGLVAFFIALLPLALKPVFEIALRQHGFPKAHIQNVRYLSDGIYIDKILLDPNGFTEIDDLQIRGSWCDLIFKQYAERISAKSLTITGEIDNKNRLTVAGWDGKFGTTNNEESTLPFRSIHLESLIADLDTPIGAIRLQGKAKLDENNGQKNIVANIITAQQQLSATIDINAVMDVAGNLSGKLDLQDTTVNIQPITISRASGWIEFKGLAIAGQLMAGGIKYNDFPFEDANLIFDTSQNPAATFKTKTTGQDLSLAADLINQAEKSINVTASSANIGALAALADIENDILSKSGPVAIKAVVKLKDNYLPKDEISVAETKINIAGGNLDIKPFTYYGDGRANTLTIGINKMRLAQLLDEDSSITANGSMSGVLPLSYKGSEITINKGVLRSDAPGSFKYTPEQMPAALQGDDPRMDTVRKALSNYDYDTLEVTLNGPVNGNLKTTLKASGKSPAFEGRPVNLNLNLEGALASALTQALKPGTLSDSLKERLTKEQQ